MCLVGKVVAEQALCLVNSSPKVNLVRAAQAPKYSFMSPNSAVVSFMGVCCRVNLLCHSAIIKSA